MELRRSTRNRPQLQALPRGALKKRVAPERRESTKRRKRNEDVEMRDVGDEEEEEQEGEGAGRRRSRRRRRR